MKSTKKKVLHFSYNYLPNIGGVEINLHNLLDSIFDSNILEGRLLVPFRFNRINLRTRYKKYIIPKNRFFDGYKWVSFCLSYIYKLWKFNAIYCSSCSYEAYYSLLWRKNKKLIHKIKIIAKTSGSDINYDENINYGQLIQNENIEMLNFLISNLDLILCTSELMKKKVIEFSSTVENKILVIPNGTNIDLERFNKLSKEKCKIELNIPSDKFVITHITRNAKVKNSKLFVEIARILEKNQKLYFIIVGDLSNDVKALINNYAIRNLKIIGKIDRISNDKYEENYIKILKSTDLGVFTSFIESFGNASSEFAFLGIPIIINNNFGIGDLISEKYREFVLNRIDVNNYICAIEKLFNNKKIYSDYSNFLIKKFSFMDYKLIRNRFEELYLNILN